MPVRALFARVALTLLLLFAQHQALLHELQHGVDAVAGKSNPASPLHDACLKCLSFAGMDHAAAPSAPAFAVPVFTHSLVSSPQPADRFVREWRAYESRAPPLSS